MIRKVGKIVREGGENPSLDNRSKDIDNIDMCKRRIIQEKRTLRKRRLKFTDGCSGMDDKRIFLNIRGHSPRDTLTDCSRKSEKT